MSLCPHTQDLWYQTACPLLDWSVRSEWKTCRVPGLVILGTAIKMQHLLAWLVTKPLFLEESLVICTRLSSEYFNNCFTEWPCFGKEVIWERKRLIQKTKYRAKDFFLCWPKSVNLVSYRTARSPNHTWYLKWLALPQKVTFHLVPQRQVKDLSFTALSSPDSPQSSTFTWHYLPPAPRSQTLPGIPLFYSTLLSPISSPPG